MIHRMDQLYELTADNVWIQQVDRQESPGPSRRVGRGTQFKIVRQRHHWGASKIEFYTIEIEGKRYNIVAKALENFMREAVMPQANVDQCL